MAEGREPTTIKKYANRRLYNTGTSTYVTLDDLGEMVKNGEDFLVFDAKTGEDITRSVLTQIIFERENRGGNLLPITFLRQLIRFYDDSIQKLVPTYLDFSIEALTREQEKFRQQLSQAFGVAATPFAPLEEHVRRNTEMFEQAMRMFLPFAGTPGRERPEAPAEPAREPATAASDFDQLKRQLDEMQKRVDQLSRQKPEGK
jgi:polyhydroxyalkanoate synthesis repressor PhaR